MVSSSNLPRHGDPIIQETPDSLGGNKLIASPQFQEFLDELGRLVNSSNQEPLSIEDLIQLITDNESTIKSSFSNLLNKINAINIDHIYINDAKISQIIAINNSLQNQIIDNGQLINVQNSLIEQQSVQLSKVNERVNDLEQLINVN